MSDDHLATIQMLTKMYAEKVVENDRLRSNLLECENRNRVLAKQLDDDQALGLAKTIASAIVDSFSFGSPNVLVALNDPAEQTASRKIQAIKTVRAATGWGLKEAKDFVEERVGAVNAR